jgi:hypothetical protein
MKNKVKSWKVESWKNKPISSEMKRFKKDIHAKGNPFEKY